MDHRLLFLLLGLGLMGAGALLVILAGLNLLLALDCAIHEQDPR